MWLFQNVFVHHILSDISVIQHINRLKVFANTLWPRSVWGQPHLVIHVSVLMATTCLSWFQMQQFSSQSDTLAGLDKGGSGTNSLHSLKPKIFMSRGTGKKCTRTFSRNVLCNLLGCEKSLLQLPQEIFLHPVDLHECFHRHCEQRSRFGQCFCLLGGK